MKHVIKTRKISLKDRETIEAIRAEYGHKTSSHAFASLFIWKEALDISIYVKENVFVAKCGSLGKNTWFFPCGRRQEVCDILTELLADKDLCLIYMRQEDCRLIEEYFPGRFLFKEVLADSEYIYDRQEQERLKGRRFSAMRNHMNHVMREHSLRVQTFDRKANWDVVFDMNMQKRSDNVSEGRCVDDETAMKRLFSNAKELNLWGVLVYVDQNPCALVAGFELSEDIIDMCFAKQTQYLTGLSVYAKHEWIKSLPTKYKWINAEEDLGLEGLRTMKQQMHPISQILMYEGKALYV